MREFHPRTFFRRHDLADRCDEVTVTYLPEMSYTHKGDFSVLYCIWQQKIKHLKVIYLTASVLINVKNVKILFGLNQKYH